MSVIACKRLEQLESEIELGIRAIGKALMEIRDTKAYLANHETFEVYCKDRWGFTDRHARDLMTAEKVREKIGRILPVETLKTQHLLEIAKIPEKKQAQVVAGILQRCETENRPPKTRDFVQAAKPFEAPKEAVAEVREREPGEDDEPLYEDVEDSEQEAKERAAKIRSSIIQHNASMMRLIDDLHELKPDKNRHNHCHSAFRIIHSTVEPWK